MSIKTIQKDIREAPLDRIICLNTSVTPVYNHGVCGAIGEIYPDAQREYYSHIKNTKKDLLGTLLLVDTGQHVIANMFSQLRGGYDGKKYVNYEAFYNCLKSLVRVFPVTSIFAFPYKVACGTGGGNFDVILPMIEEVLANYQVEFYNIHKTSRSR